MNYRRLGRSDLQVSEISLGRWTMGGKNWVENHMNGWADVDEDEVTTALKLAVDRGVNHFDNAVSVGGDIDVGLRVARSQIMKFTNSCLGSTTGTDVHLKHGVFASD